MMTGKQRILTTAWMMAGFGVAEAGAQELPAPEVYVRAEDQERARLYNTPCTKADAGRGCHGSGGNLMRAIPCTYQIEENVFGSLPTDQCFKMEEPRQFRGVWIDEFEGQAFVPEGTKAPEWPKGDANSPGWREQFDRAQAATIWLDVERVKLGPGYGGGGGRFLIEFIGRKTMYQGRYGHFGMSGHEIIVDRVISLKPCPAAGDCG